jgi:sugar phosphate isomerase/epimerase
VVLAVENHWGLSRTPEGLLRIVNAIKSPWLGAMMDTGNFLEDPYDKLKTDRAEDGVRAGQDLLRRRRMVHARSGLRAHREDSRRGELQRIRVAGI